MSIQQWTSYKNMGYLGVDRAISIVEDFHLRIQEFSFDQKVSGSSLSSHDSNVLFLSKKDKTKRSYDFARSMNQKVSLVAGELLGIIEHSVELRTEAKQ